MEIETKISKMLRNVSEVQNSRGAFATISSKVIKLNSGDPSFKTPLHICEAATKAMNEGYTHYCSGLGDRELRESICASLYQDYGVRRLPEEILITNGAAEAILLCALSFLDMGDEAIVFDPSYSLYVVGVQATGAKAVRVPLSQTFHYDEQELIKRITPRTKLIFLNNPNNPTATCFSREDLNSIAAIADKHDLLVVADEVYHKLLFEDRKHICASSIETMKERVILINSFSKSYAMTGWRIGYIAAPLEIIKALVPFNRALTGSINTISQRAALAALQESQDCVLKMKEEYEKRRRIICSLANKIEGLSCALPEGAFYIFCRFEYELTADEMVEYLMENGVAVRSGTEFGTMGENHIRITFASSMEAIEGGMEKISQAFKQLK